MSQHDFEITTADANTGITFRDEINRALQALASCSSGPSAPSVAYPYQVWFNTSENPVGFYRRKGDNSGWVKCGYIDATTGKLMLDAAQIANTPSGNISATDVQAAINELDSEKVNKSGSSELSASQIANIPSGNISATDVQAAINELDSELNPQYRRQISGCVGGNPLSVPANSTTYCQMVAISIPASKRLEFNRISYWSGDSSLYVTVNCVDSGYTWTASNTADEKMVNQTIYDNSGGSTVAVVGLRVGLNNSDTISHITSSGGWWLDLSIR